MVGKLCRDVVDGGLRVRRCLDIQAELDLTAARQGCQAHLVLVAVQAQFRAQLIEVDRRQVQTACQQNGAMVGKLCRDVVDGGTLVEQVVYGQADIQAGLTGSRSVVEQAQAGRGSNCAWQRRGFRRGGHHRERQGDRKSTRLNSSHGYISYAVFCLKKKKKRSYLQP